jgi:hypothetical protein
VRWSCNWFGSEGPQVLPCADSSEVSYTYDDADRLASVDGLSSFVQDGYHDAGQVPLIL